VAHLLGLPEGLRHRRRAQSYYAGVQDHFGEPVLWWSRQGRATTAVAMVTTSPGRVGFLYHSPPQAEQTDPYALPEVIREATACALQRGATIVQSMVDIEDAASAEAAREAGYQHLADLVHMECPLAGVELGGAVDWPEDVTVEAWREGQGGQEQMLEALLAATYVDSKDCPQLAGQRTMEDVIASHRTTGDYVSGAWWVLRVADKPAGCVLLNRRSSRSGLWDVVYMGLVPQARHRGLGRTLLRHAGQYVRSHEGVVLALAVDAANAPARKLYEGFGFVENHRRACWICLSPQPMRSNCE
jgi:GNAT superfamily N-acetyltransferase